jgi:hypothetical protein
MDISLQALTGSEGRRGVFAEQQLKKRLAAG